MVFQVGAFSDAAVFRIACPIIQVLLSLDIHLVQVVARQPLLNSRLKKNKKDADVADSNSRVERSTLGYITGLSKP